MVEIFSDKSNKKPYRKKSRKEFECPSKLDELLAKMSWLEASVTLQPFIGVRRMFEMEHPNLDQFEVLQLALEECLKESPDELKNFVQNVPQYEFFLERITVQTRRYEDYRLSRLKLSRFVMLKGNKNIGKSKALEAINEEFGGAGRYELDEKKDIVEIGFDSFGEAITDKRVILDRVRSCEICKRVFWAVNKNSNACSPSHADNLRNRKSRKIKKERTKEKKDLENAKRRKNYEYKKKLKKGK